LPVTHRSSWVTHGQPRQWAFPLACWGRFNRNVTSEEVSTFSEHAVPRSTPLNALHNFYFFWI
jgi:hypothetical protein